MNKRNRVMAAIRGEPVDRVPLGFWLHDFASEHSAQALADTTLGLYRSLDLDFIKPQSRATCFAEMWGTRIQSSTEKTEIYTVREFAVQDAAGLGSLEPAEATQGALAEQLEAYLAVRAAVGPDVPIIATIFSPLMATRLMLPGGRDAVLQLMRDDPAALERGLAAIAETLGQHARRCIAAGIDGIFYAESYATQPLMSGEEVRRFQHQFDLPILDAVKEAPFNILHVCGNNTRFDDFIDYPVSVFSWATTPGNPSLNEVRERTGRAVLGGLPGRPLAEMTVEALVERTRQSIGATGGRHHLLGPDCSLHPGTPIELLQAVAGAVKASAHQ
ncbi:uroporphyrinogen decarboxylase family protein [Mesorhizobium sp. ANAO-SY3R2]|uniref:uroporphyrinogen decarboxylase family protein n=1 Tax=Mesorhizobium sp. ANAO-SY3R2 TaxID=3166644 RepID=UPI00366F9300